MIVIARSGATWQSVLLSGGGDYYFENLFFAVGFGTVVGAKLFDVLFEVRGFGGLNFTNDVICQRKYKSVVCEVWYLNIPAMIWMAKKRIFVSNGND